MDDHPGLAPVEIRRFRNGRLTATDDLTAVEEPLSVRLCSGGRTRTVAITMRTPGRDADLARGFLFTEGVLPARARVPCHEPKSNVMVAEPPAAVMIDWERLNRHSYTSSSCGVCGKTSLEQVYQTLPFPAPLHPLRVPAALLPELPPKLRNAQVLFDRTGGIHAAGLFSAAGDLHHFAEDVGRHNALDKLIGYAYHQDLLPLEDHVLVLSGRASFELLQKAGMAGLRIVVAVGAPSSLAVGLARELNITLCGFTSARGFNCYAGHERLQNSDKLAPE